MYPRLPPAQSCDHLPQVPVLAVNGWTGNAGTGAQGRLAQGPDTVAGVGGPPCSTQEWRGRGVLLCTPLHSRMLARPLILGATWERAAGAGDAHPSVPYGTGGHLAATGSCCRHGGTCCPGGEGGDPSSPQCTHRRQHSCCGTFRKGPGGKETERVVLQVPGFSVVHGPFQPCQCAAHRQSPFLRRGRQSCLRGVAGGEGDRQQHCTLDQHLLDQLLQLHAPPPSPCCGSFGEEKPLAVPCPPGKPLAKNASSMSLSALAL